MATDYTRTTGSTGTMMIRDYGSSVEFWLQAGSATYSYQLPWAYYAQGSSSSWMSFRFESGGAWQYVGSADCTYSQTIRFEIGSSGTSGLGGPTQFDQYISREPTSSRPNPPSACTISNITPTSIRAQFTDGSNNGSAITQRQIGISTGSGVYLSYDSTYATFENLTPGTKYYFLGRTRNANGWSDWGPIVSAMTLVGAYLKVNGVHKLALPYVKVAGVWKPARPWVKTSGVWKQTS